MPKIYIGDTQTSVGITQHWQGWEQNKSYAKRLYIQVLYLCASVRFWAWLIC